MFCVLRLSCLVFILASIGCGGGPSGVVEGTVTLDGEPLEHGAISLKSSTGDANTVGDVIEGGKFKIEEVPEGSFVAYVTASKKGAGGGPNASSRDGENGGNDDPEFERFIAVKNAEGNNKKVEIKSGKNEITIALTTSGS